MIITASIVVGILMAALLFHSLFDGVDDLLDCLRSCLTPDIFAVFRGEWDEQVWAKAKLFVYVGLSAGSGALTFFGLHKLFG